MNPSAETLFASGLNCAQSVLGSHAPSLGFDRDQALRLSAGLGAGLGRKQQVCGAVSGAALVLGLRYGYTEASDQAGKERVYALTRTLQDRFAAVHGSVVCRELLGCDLLTPEGQKTMKDRNLVETFCLNCVATADRLVTELMKENP